MLKYLAAVVSSVVLSTSLMLGMIHWQTPDFTPIRAATHQLKGQFGTCSGVLIGPNTFLTAAHCDQPEMTVEGKTAILLKKDEKRDLMVLYVRIDGPYIPVSRETPSLDTKVYVVGYPLGLPQVITEGRLQNKLHPDFPFRQITAPIIFGNSGGPVIAFMHGEYMVVGIVSAVAGDMLGGIIPYVVAHLDFMATTESINQFLE